MKYEFNKNELKLVSEIGSREFAQAKMFNFLQEAGYLVSFQEENPQFSKWFFNETKERDAKKMNIIGPQFEGEIFYDILLGKDTEKTRLIIQKIQKAYQAAAKQNIKLPNIGPMAILVSENALLFLPREFCKRSIESLSGEKKFELYERFANLSLKGNEAQSFTLAVYLYIFLTGTFPFSATNEEKKQEQIKYNTFIPLNLYNPQLPKALVDAIETTLKGKRDSNLEFPLIGTEIQTANEVEKKSGKDLKEERNAWTTKKEKSNKRLIFLKKNQVAIISSLVAFVLLVVIGASLLNDKRQTANSIGLSDIETIEAFYTAINTLDVSLSSNLLYRITKSPYTSVIASYHVIKATRQSYENMIAFTHPLEKLERGQDEESGIYGITNLTVQDTLLNPFSPKATNPKKNPPVKVKDGEKKRYFVYYNFITNEGEDMIRIDHCEDSIDLLFYKNRWYVYNIISTARTETDSYTEFLEDLAGISILTAEEKAEYLQNYYPWLPSAEEVRLILSERKK